METLLVNDCRESAASSTGRRSSRIFQAIHLNIRGKNRTGNPLSESTSSMAVSCHGCLYPSRYEYPTGSWVTLQVLSPSADQEVTTVRAQVKFVRLPRNPRELYQVGVELESPGNIWGIPAPPTDWQPYLSSQSESSAEPNRLGELTSEAPSSGAPASDRQVATNAALENRSAAIEAVSAPASTASAAQAVEGPGLSISSDLLRSALEGVLQQAAEKAVASALSCRLGAAVNYAAKAIEGFSHASVRKVEEQCALAVERFEASVRHDVLSRLQAEVTAAEQQFQNQIEYSLGKAQQAVMSMEKMATDEAELRLIERTGEAQARLQAVAASSLSKLHNVAQEEIARTANELRQGGQSSIAAFAEQSKAEWEARQRSCHDELARSARQEIDQFRHKLETVLGSSMSTAIAAANEHSRILFNSLVRGTAEQLSESSRG